VNGNQPGHRPRNRRRRLALAPAVLLLLLPGCSEQEIVAEYGHRTGLAGTSSVNGTAVLGEMFAKAGHSVESKRALTPSLGDAQAIVWFPDSYQVPPEDVRKWLDRWLWEEPGRTLIYVGRGYDAEPTYWRKVLAKVAADQKSQCKLRQAFAEARVKSKRGKLKNHDECDWFELINNDPPLEASSLEGPWAAEIDVAKTDIELSQEMVPLEWFEVLLESEDHALVSREVTRAGDTWRQRVFVANGSFLLNFALVNHEHRKLAGRLIELVGPPGRVVFLESGEKGPRIFNADPAPELPQTLALFGVWPINVVLLHFAVLGIIFGFARWPIFGNPQSGEPVNVSNFADHAVALGKLLQRTAQRDYAVRRLAEYRNLKP
jgi:hypothetical protein